MSLLRTEEETMVSPDAQYDFVQLSAGGTKTVDSPSTSLLEEEETALPCNSRIWFNTGEARECGNRATWVGLLRCCGHLKHLCDPHKEQWVNLGRVPIIECVACKFNHGHANPFAVLERL